MWEVVGWPDLAFDLGKLPFHEPKFLLLLPTSLPDFIPALKVSRPVTLDVLGQGMQREVRSGESEVVKEGFIGMLLGMFLQDINGMIGDGVSHVKLRTDRCGRLSLVIEIMEFQAEETMVIDVVGTVKASSQRQAVNMPFTRVIRAVTGRLKHHWQEMCPRGTITFFNTGQIVSAHLLSIISGQKRGAGRPATGSVVELGKAQAVLGQTIQVGSIDFPTIAAQIRIPHVIGHNQQDVRWLGLSPRGKENC